MEKYEGFTDEELIRMYRQGEVEVGDFLINKYKNLVRKQANALYLIGGDPEDLIQEGTIGLFKAIRDYDEQKGGSFFHFAHVCISRQLATAIQASNRVKHKPLNEYVSFFQESGKDSEEYEDYLAVDEASPETLILEKEQMEEFWSKIGENLSKMEKKVLELYLNGYNYSQIADIMEKRPKSIDNAIQRIRNKIKLMINV